MEFRILGELEVRHEGREVPISGAQQRKALAVLLLESGRTVSMHRLMEALWQGEPPATARRQVRNIVAAVRRSLAAADPIERSGDGYRLRTEATDWHEFRTAVREAAHADDAATYRRLREALRLWRGPVLAGLDSEFIAAAAAGMEEARVAALEELHDAALALGLHREVSGELRTLVAEHPFRQRLNGQLMLALYRSGNGAAALRVFAELSARLADELGIEPDRRLRNRYVAILREDPSLDLDPPPQVVPPRERVRTEDTAPPAPPAPTPPPARRPAAPAQWRAPRRTSRLSSRGFSRLVALGLVVFAVVVAIAGDGRLRLPPEERRPLASVANDVLREPLWTYPALEAGSAVMEVDAGLLVLDGTELRLEADGEVVWSKYLDAQSASSAAVFAESVVLASSPAVDLPGSTGGFTALGLGSGELSVWSPEGWPVARTEDGYVTIRCGRTEEGRPLPCSMASNDPRSLLPQWEAVLDEQSFPLRTEVPYESPWMQPLPTDFLLVRSAADTGDRLSVYHAGTGALLSEFDYEGVEGAQVNGGLLMLYKGSSSGGSGRCEAHVVAYDLHSAAQVWERFVETTEGGDGRCRPPSTLQGASDLFPATLGRTASVVWSRSGELQWSVPEPSAALMLVDNALVAAEAATGDLAVWDVWSHDKRWTANAGKQMWARGATLWVLDHEAIGPDCGGMVAYSLATGEAACPPGSLVHLSEDEVVTVDNGTWKAWPADPWG